jgi:hypothetical protein
MNDEQISIKLTNMLEQAGIKVRDKDEVWWQKILAKILFFVPNYMRNFSNAVYNCIDLGQVAEDSSRRWETLIHELKHIIDSHNWYHVPFGVGYLFPQILALLSLGAVWGSGWWLLWLVALLPWPALFRVLIETPAYAYNLIIAELRGRDVDEVEKRILTTLSGSSYYFAMPLKVVIRKLLWYHFKKRVKHIRNYMHSFEMAGKPQYPVKITMSDSSINKFVAAALYDLTKD